METKATQILVIAAILIVLGFSIYAFIGTKVSGIDKLPEAAQRNPMVREAYLFAKENPDLLEKMPCYCGCANMGHKNNKDCYFDSEGNFVEHASLCGGCVGITLDVKELSKQGKSVDEIREFINDKYG